jgi:hypothetical protein
VERLSEASRYDKASLNEATLAKKQCIKLSKSEGVGRLMTDRKAVKAPTHVAHSQIDNHMNESDLAANPSARRLSAGYIPVICPFKVTSSLHHVSRLGERRSPFSFGLILRI